MERENELSMYDELAARHNAAYGAFRAIYEAKLPPPKPPVEERDSIFVPVALVIMIAASVLVSGSRTIAEFGGGFIGFMAFLMLEGAIIAYAFYRTRRNFNEERLETVRRLANFGLGLAFVVAAAANVNDVLKGSGETSPQVKTIIHLLVALSAPTLAFISGDIMAVETMANQSKKRWTKEKYETELATWLTGLNEAWANEKARWGVSIKVEREQKPVQSVHVNSLNERVNEQPRLGYSANSSTGYSKRMDARSLIHEFFEQHPEQLNSRLDELVGLIEQEKGVKVGRTSIHNVRREIMQLREE